MTSRRRGRQSFGPRRPRQRTEWISTTLAEQSLAPGGSSIVDLLSGLTVADKQRVDRVVRTIMWFRYWNETANAEVHGRIGIHPLTDDSMAAGSGQDPAGDFRGSWLFNEQYYTDSPDVGDPREIRFDTKVQRRIPSLTTLAFMIEANAASAGQVQWGLGLRLLYAVK